MEGIAVEYFPNTDNLRKNEPRSEFHSYKSDQNERYACYSSSYMVYVFNILIESGLLFYGLSTIWEETDGCTKKYRCVLTVYLMNV